MFVVFSGVYKICEFGHFLNAFSLFLYDFIFHNVVFDFFGRTLKVV